MAIEIKSHTDALRDPVAKVVTYRERGLTYAVAINPETRAVEAFGTPADGLVLDFDAIIDA